MKSVWQFNTGAKIRTWVFSPLDQHSSCPKHTVSFSACKVFTYDLLYAMFGIRRLFGILALPSFTSINCPYSSPFRTFEFFHDRLSHPETVHHISCPHDVSLERRSQFASDSHQGVHNPLIRLKSSDQNQLCHFAYGETEARARGFSRTIVFDQRF